MIKKTFLTLCLLAPLTCGAQVIEVYPGLQLNKLSDNGRYIAESTSGICIHDRETDQTFNYGTTYTLGGGSSISNTGVAVGATNSYTVPAYWQNGVWTPLPVPIEGTLSYGCAEGISTDGKFIVGSMDCRPITKKAWPMVSPVIWTLNEATGTYECTLLPEPDKDITTCSPQQVSARAVSRDGKTVLGQVTDYRGLLRHQIIYHQAPDGTWSYEFSGDERLLKEDATWPEYPSMPQKPQAADYLTNDEILAFNQANQAYMDSLEIVALTGKQPHMPFYEEFILERKDEFEADMAQYEVDSDLYLVRLRAFQQAYVNNLTNNVFQFNSHIMSANGLYYSSNYIYTGPATAASSAPTYISPIVYSTDGSVPSRVIEHSSMTLFSVCDDGTVVACTPTSDDYVVSRTPYIIPLNQEPVLYKDWVAANYPDVYDWMQSNLTFDLAADESESGQAETGVLLCGSVRLNSDATKAIAYFIEPGTSTYLSYVVDFTAESTGISAAPVAGKPSVHADTASGQLFIQGNPSLVEVFDLSGRRLYSGTPGATLSLRSLQASGVCLVKLHAGNATTTQKVILK